MFLLTSTSAELLYRKKKKKSQLKTACINMLAWISLELEIIDLNFLSSPTSSGWESSADSGDLTKGFLGYYHSINVDQHFIEPPLS